MMDGRDRRPMVPGRRTEDNVDEAALKVLSLALSEAALLALPRHVLQPHSNIRRIGLVDLTDELMTGPSAPGLVLSPLLTAEFDALDLARILSQCGYRGLDLARILSQCGYRGRYLALVDRLPSANLIRREVAAQSPNINFDVIVLDGSTPLHSL